MKLLFPSSRPLAITMAAMMAVLAGLETACAEPAQGYVLTPEEQALDCKKLTGRMQVRIFDLRDYATRSKSTAVSRGLQSVATGIFGGTDHGIRPDDQHARDVAQLKAYNRQLIAKDCKSFDLEAELQPKSVRDTPTPTIAAPSKSKVKDKTAKVP